MVVTQPGNRWGGDDPQEAGLQSVGVWNPAMKVLNIRTANTNEALLVSDILIEAAAWLEERAMPMWQLNELSPELILSDVAGGLFALA